MIAYTGIETISNMAEEARDARGRSRAGSACVVLAVFGLYVLIPIVALSAMPVTQDAAGHYTTVLGTKFAGDPVLGIVENLGLGAGLTDALRIYVGVLAAVILVIATNAGLIGVSRLTYSMGQHRQLPRACGRCTRRFQHALRGDPRLLGDRRADDPPGPDRLPGDDVLVRRDAVVHDRARLGDPAAAAAPGVEREWKPPLNFRAVGFEVPATAILGGLGTFAAWIIVMVLQLDDAGRSAPSG